MVLVHEKIRAAALAFLDEGNISSPPVPVEQIAVAHEIQIVRSYADSTESGFLLRAGQRTVLGVNSRYSPQRQRFIIAHALGHWRLHHNMRLIVDHSVSGLSRCDRISSNPSDTQEIEANQFVAELLIPSRFVTEALEVIMTAGVGSRTDVVAGLATQFDVGTETMSWRLTNLGVLSH
jgi:Zn-dependent peptidase ImmA (M78 family)